MKLTPAQNITRAQRLRALFQIRKRTFERCLAVPACEKPAIRAHSIQNARVLDLLAVENHVYAPEVTMDSERGPQVSIARVGRNDATTFTGLCAEHDARFFAAIDKAPLDVASDEHRFLLAWRAAFFESHATGVVVQQTQAAYQKRVEFGLDPSDEPSPAGLHAVSAMCNAWQVYRWRVDLDLAYHEARLPLLCHESLVLDVRAPTVAAAGLFSVGTRRNPNDLRCVTLNILPLSRTRTWVLFSFKPGDRREARKALRRVLDAPAHNLKYQVSRLLLQRCQNFVLSPAFAEMWSPERKRSVVSFFERTLWETECAFDSPDLQLFT
jgi:hypothetical protein